jgi:hypothetical protein
LAFKTVPEQGRQLMLDRLLLRTAHLASPVL